MLVSPNNVINFIVFLQAALTYIYLEYSFSISCVNQCYLKVQKASSMLEEVILNPEFHEVWNDVKGYKCAPPLLDCPLTDKDITTQSILNGIRQVVQKKNILLSLSKHKM